MHIGLGDDRGWRPGGAKPGSVVASGSGPAAHCRLNLWYEIADPGATVQVFSGCGQNSAAGLYWCNSGSAIWNNTGDTAFLLDPSGNIVDSYSYS
jgi:hypothetical protein